MELCSHRFRIPGQLRQIAQRDQREDAQRKGADGLADKGRRAQAAVRQPPGERQPRKAHDRRKQIDGQVAHRRFSG